MSPDIVVVNFRSTPLISTTVTLIREFAGEEARLIVVDNSPGDGAAEIVRAAAPGATIITNWANRGFAAGVNEAVAVAEADIVSLLNPDVQCFSGSYADVAAAFREPRVAAVATRLRNADGTEQPNRFRAPRPFDLLSENLALAERFPRWQRPRHLRMPKWTGTTPAASTGPRAPASYCAGPRSPTWVRSTSASSCTTRRLIGSCGRSSVVGTPFSADGRGGARFGWKLSGSALAAVSGPARESASLRTEALRTDEGGASPHDASSESTPRTSPATRSPAERRPRAAAADRIRVHLTMRAARPS
jgi:Glycosyl transferase family 2